MAVRSTFPPEGVHSETGRFSPETEVSEFQRVVEFAGFDVPEGGLVLAPPFGGELTVWPDGQYVFTCPVSGDGGLSMVATHYSYVVEALDGATAVGSFALGEQTPEEVMPDFQSWSLEDILALEDAVGLVIDQPGPLAEFAGAQFAGHEAVAPAPGMACGGLDQDVLDHLINVTYES